jgi:RNA recognition motif-containing protein
MQDRATGRSRGFAFIEMGSQEDANKAISLFHQKDFQGRPLTVNEALRARIGHLAAAAAEVVEAGMAGAAAAIVTGVS